MEQPVVEASYFDGADELPSGISATIKRGDTQLAVWRFRGRFYATQHMCPHKRAFVLADGLLGERPRERATTTTTRAPRPGSRVRTTSATSTSPTARAPTTRPSPSPPLPSTRAPTASSMVRKADSGPPSFAELDANASRVGRCARRPDALRPGPRTVVAAAGCRSTPEW